MVQDITEHPDAPDLETIGELFVEPVPLDDIRRYQNNDYELVENNLVERDDLDVRIPLRRASDGRELDQDIGTLLYRLVQAFGTPQWPSYFAGEDISDRSNTTFKYLLRVTGGDGNTVPEEWLMTIFDWKVGLGVGVGEWLRDGDGEVYPEPTHAYTTLRLAHNISSDPLKCEYEDIWY